MSQSEPQAELPAPQSPGPAPQFPLGSPSTPQRLVSFTPSQAPEQSSPPSSSGSNKRLADPDISELVRKAKASRFNNQPPKRNDDELEDMLETDLSCAICSEVLSNPVACLDCLHKFCGACLVPWFERSDTCPTCRQKVKRTRDERDITQLIEKLLNRFPDKKRDPDELKELELAYKPGQKINITNTYSDDDEPDPEEEEDEGITWSPCPCCTTPNNYGFTCLDPIPPPHPVRGPQRADVFSYRSHLRCQSCPNNFPTNWNPGWKCENCSVFNCGNLFGCILPNLLLRPVSDLAANLPPYVYNGGIAPMFGGNDEVHKFVNSTEMELLSAWMTASNLTWLHICQKIYTYLLDKNANVIPFSLKQLRPEEFACQPCMTQVLTNNFHSWWIHERETTGFVDNRMKCWYGRGCRTQTHNMEHAKKCCHSCEETPPHLRRNAVPPRDDGPVLAANAPVSDRMNLNFGDGVVLAGGAPAGGGGSGMGLNVGGGGIGGVGGNDSRGANVGDGNNDGEAP